MYKKLLLLLVGLGATTLLAPLAFADGFTTFNTNCAGGSTDLCGYTVTFDIHSAGGNTFSVNYTITDTTGAHPGTFQLFQVTAFSGAVTNIVQPGNGTANASNGNNGGSCTGNTSGSICFTPTSPPTLALGQSFSTSFTVTDTSILASSTWNWKTLVTGANGNIVAISATGPVGTPVPEPASMVLLGSGLLGLGGVARRFKK